MKTDNNNIVVETVDKAAQKYVRDMDKASATKKQYAIKDFTYGANWQKEQLQQMIDSHAELLTSLKDAHKLLLTVGSTDWWIKHKEECAQIYDTIQKANNLI